MSIFKKKPASAKATVGKTDEKDDKKPEVKKAEVNDVKKQEVKTDSKESPSAKATEDKKKSMKELYKKEDGVKKIVNKKGEEKNVTKFDQAYRVLVKPLVTEKASKLGEENKYAFVVSIDANKISVGKAIEQVYGVKPIKINIVNIKGKRVRSKRMMGKRKDWRKAIVTLPKGKNINIYEGV